MMNTDFLNTLILAALIAAVTGVGFFITNKQQPAELERLEKEETTLRLRNAEVSDLLAEQAGSRALAEEAMRRWNSRYKVLPQHLTSPAVVAYLNDLSRDGFKSFDVSLGGISQRNGYSTLAYTIRGQAFFETLYRFIWEVENGRGLYRISDLNVREVSVDQPNPVTDVPRRVQLVEFSMRLEAYFGGADGMSAPDSIVTVPDWVLPAKSPVENPFFPGVMAALPPNTDNLVDVEADELVSVVGDVAVFRGSLGARPVRQGDRVYLGRITQVDPTRAYVVAELNKGGIRERLEIRLASGERFRESLGNIQLTPLSAPRFQRPSPPQPGTPEYRRLQSEAVDALMETATGAATESAAARQQTTAQPERGVAIRPFPGARPDPTENDD